MHPKVKALRQRSAAINYSNTSVDAGGNLVTTDLDKGIVKGYVFTWGTINDRREMFSKTAFDKSINERGPKSNSKMPIKFLAYHNQTKPLSLFAKIQPDDIGLYFETLPLDEVSYSGDIKIGLRSGTLNNFSGGFNPNWDKSIYVEESDAIMHKEVSLFEISVVSLAADDNTYQVRSKITDEDAEEMNERILSFVGTLPRPFRNEARELFTRQKSLYLFEPESDDSDTLEDEKPVKKRVIDYKFLTKKLSEK